MGDMKTKTNKGCMFKLIDKSRLVEVNMHTILFAKTIMALAKPLILVLKSSEKSIYTMQYAWPLKHLQKNVNDNSKY